MQGGICTPKEHPVVIAFTGASGRQHGYADGWATDGVYRYFGEGQSGDMSWKRGNIAIRAHAANGEDLLLFQTLGGGSVRFLGEFVCAGYDLEPALDGTGAMRQAIIFNLVPAPDLEDDASLASNESSGTSDLQTLRTRALAAVTTPTQADRTTAKRNVYERSREIRAYVLARANGHCEACSRPASFIAFGGTPYLHSLHRTHATLHLRSLIVLWRFRRRFQECDHTFPSQGRQGSEFPCDSIGRGAPAERSSHDLARLRASRAFSAAFASRVNASPLRIARGSGAVIRQRALDTLFCLGRCCYHWNA
jgi:5-methylcytosine-specific restriction protein A